VRPAAARRHPTEASAEANVTGYRDIAEARRCAINERPVGGLRIPKRGPTSARSRRAEPLLCAMPRPPIQRREARLESPGQSSPAPALTPPCVRLRTRRFTQRPRVDGPARGGSQEPDGAASGLARPHAWGPRPRSTTGHACWGRSDRPAYARACAGATADRPDVAGSTAPTPRTRPWSPPTARTRPSHGHLRARGIGRIGEPAGRNPPAGPIGGLALADRFAEGIV